MKYPRNVKPFTGRLDVAPFAGVFFLLVLFLLLQTSLAPVPGVRIQLPAAVFPEPPGVNGPALVVAIDRQGQAYFNLQAVSETELARELTNRVKASPDPITLVLQADEAVGQGMVVRLMAIARQAGIRETVISLRPPLLPGPATAPQP